MNTWPVLKEMLRQTDTGAKLTEIDFANIQTQLGTGWSDFWLIGVGENLDAMILTTMRTGVNNWLFIDYVFVEEGLDYKTVLRFFMDEIMGEWCKKIGVKGVGIMTTDEDLMRDDRFKVLDMVVGEYTDGTI